MKITMYGNGGAGNHGCEAISRGTVELLGANEYRILSENCREDAQYGLDICAAL